MKKMSDIGKSEGDLFYRAPFTHIPLLAPSKPPLPSGFHKSLDCVTRMRIVLIFNCGYLSTVFRQPRGKQNAALGKRLFIAPIFRALPVTTSLKLVNPQVTRNPACDVESIKKRPGNGICHFNFSL
ncbi:hypothetical protein [Lonsdalea quercina]|uniref:hypothetical protein n=2 Tax=Lonsdalea quercina TaxID=71657 RepID=UPI00397669A1